MHLDLTKTLCSKGALEDGRAFEYKRELDVVEQLALKKQWLEDHFKTIEGEITGVIRKQAEEAFAAELNDALTMYLVLSPFDGNLNYESKRHNLRKKACEARGLKPTDALPKEVTERVQREAMAGTIFRGVDPLATLEGKPVTIWRDEDGAAWEPGSSKRPVSIKSSREDALVTLLEQDPLMEQFILLHARLIGNFRQGLDELAAMQALVIVRGMPPQAAKKPSRRTSRGASSRKKTGKVSPDKSRTKSPKPSPKQKTS